MNQALSVSTLNNQIKSLLETTFVGVYVQGEISNLTYHSSGHIYFSIKDENSTISCVMFRGNAQYLKFRLEVGMKIIISGSITAYIPRGNYQLMCTKIDPDGQGSLALAFEQLKEKLQKEGLFDINIKKTLPKYPKRVVMVTSSTGAAIEDMKKVAQNRWPLARLILIPTLVQGEGSKLNIVNSIKKADSLNCDVMIVGRGGGSIEDLWAFNEEIVARAIFEAKTPVISAVGHEVDFLISDFVADVRAATPSNAMEIALPDKNEHLIYLDNLQVELENRFKRVLFNKEQILLNYKKHFEQHSLDRKFSFIQKEIDFLKSNLISTFSQVYRQKQNELNYLKSAYESNHPDRKIVDGYVQLSKNNQIVSLDSVKINEEITLETTKLSVRCNILDIKKI
ncbi:MAG: exodeoxyribonuclease VII large subunit [Arcobacter sp.]|uniref:exodeoxyribonuclease VII large subunit n=1 Tax=uncultured Arcobacter sp. TaxID=165434 RepID=UPI000CAE0FE4|nr:exodeoxyribonuclease VII large subunit [uncultured Arcobacter sp.]PLY09418.1 MAG: exodeoxyribonuclease VII large subunit [Arcobacter sp.]